MKTSIISDLRKENNDVFGLLYEMYFSMVKKFVRMNSGSEAEAEELFRNTVATLIDKLRRDNFQLTASIKTYIMAIAKTLWYRKFWVADRGGSHADIYTRKNREEIDLFIEKESSVSERLQYSLQKISGHFSTLIHSVFF